jgi:hypothetical protein
MKWPLTWTKTADAEQQTWKDRTSYWRDRAEKAEESLETEVFAREKATRLFSDLYDQHERVLGRNAVLCTQVEDAKKAGFAPEPTADKPTAEEATT